MITVGVSDIINSGQSDKPIQYVAGIHQSNEQENYDLYRGEWRIMLKSFEKGLLF